MSKLRFKDLEKMNMTKLSGASLKKQISDMLASSSQCKAILETINQDTGEYRIVLQGIIEKNHEVVESN
ncbi:MAG: hypothetical protein ACE5IY_16880 [bacterium]